MWLLGLPEPVRLRGRSRLDSSAPAAAQPAVHPPPWGSSPPPVQVKSKDSLKITTCTGINLSNLKANNKNRNFYHRYIKASHEKFSMKKSFYSTSKFNIVKQCCGVAPIRLLWALVGREFKKSLHSSIIRQSSSNSIFILTKSGGRFRLLLSTVIMFAAAVGNMTKI